MRLSSLPHRALVSGLVFALAACAESATAPVVTDGVGRVSATASSRYKTQDDIEAQAVIDGKGVTSLQLSTGFLAYFDDQNRMMVPAVPGTYALKSVHVKFCKGYKALGVKEFSANFQWKENGVDNEPDLEPDSPFDPGDKDHVGVNWDRSAAKTTLNGSGEVSIPFTGIPVDALLDIQVHYYKATGKVDKYGKAEVKEYEVKFCIPTTAAPDIGLSAPFGGNQGSTTTAKTFGYWVGITGGAPLPVTAICKAYIGSNPVPVGVSAPITVGGTLSQQCQFSIKFPTTGPQQLTFKLENITPSDYDLSNNVATRTVDVGEDAPVDGGGTIVFTMNPTIKETSKHFITSPTPAPGSTTTDIPIPVDVTDFGQDSKIVVTFGRLFTSPVRLRVTQSSGGRVIDVSDVTFGNPNGCHDQGGDQNADVVAGNTHTTVYSISLCSNPGLQTTKVEYDTYAKGVTTNGVTYPASGVFVPYGSTITYTVQLLNTVQTSTGPKTWSWNFDLTTPITYEYSAGTGAVDPKCNDAICYNQRTLSDYSRIGSAFGTDLPKVSVPGLPIN